MIIAEQLERPRLRVLAITPGIAPGGAEQHLATLIRHSNRVDYVGVIAEYGCSNPLSFETGVIIAEGDVVKAVNEFQGGYDLIYYWGFKPLDLAFTNVPVVHCIHFSATEDPNPGHQEYVKVFGDTRANFLCCVSESGVTAFPEWARKITRPKVIHNGADMERTRPIDGREMKRQAWGLDPDQKLLLYVGRFFPGKGPDVLVKSLEFLPDEYVVCCYGWGQQRAELVELAKRFPGRVILPKPRLMGLGDVYAAADTVVIPSNSEAFPLVMIEAWQSRTPLVCSAFQTLLDMERMVDGQSLAWHTSRPPEPEGLAVAIEQVDAKDARVERAYELASTRFTASAMVGRWERYFYDCVRQWLNAGLHGEMERI